jgi:Tfp pilus assembly protein PilZ
MRVPGAKLSYFHKFLFFSSILYSEEFCPVIDISRGGVQFQSKKFHKFQKKILMKVHFPDEKSCLNLKGKVKWSLFSPSHDYDYHIGVQFEAFVGRRGYNQPVALDKLEELEQKFMPNNSTSP